MVSFWIFSEDFPNNWQKRSGGLTKLHFKCPEEIFCKLISSKKWFSIVFSFWTKTSGFWRNCLAALSRLHLTCPGGVSEETVFFPNFLFKYSRTLRAKKWDLWHNEFRMFVRKGYLWRLFFFRSICFSLFLQFWWKIFVFV